MKPFQTLFLVVVAIWTGWLLLDGWRTGSVWVKGRDRDGPWWGHKVDRDESPTTYWFFMSFYALTCGWMMVLTIFDHGR